MFHPALLLRLTPTISVTGIACTLNAASISYCETVHENVYLPGSDHHSGFKFPLSASITWIMLHYYDYPLESLSEQLGRLKPAGAVIDAGIPCVVWAEDALSFVHNIPAALFCLELFVPDELANAASQAITHALPYLRMKAPPEWWQEWKCIDPTMALWTTTSIPLEFTLAQNADNELMPRQIWIHPHSIYHFDVRDRSLSVALEDRYPEPFNRIRFNPTCVAFLDALIATIFEQYHRAT